MAASTTDRRADRCSLVIDTLKCPAGCSRAPINLRHQEAEKGVVKHVCHDDGDDDGSDGGMVSGENGLGGERRG